MELKELALKGQYLRKIVKVRQSKTHAHTLTYNALGAFFIIM